MKIHLDRNRLFAVLGAFEEDLRLIIERHLLLTHYEKQIFGPAYARAVARFASDDQQDVAQTSVIDYLDLGDELEILNRWREDLPPQTRDSFVRQSGRLAELLPIRNRVVHRRPLLMDDFDKVNQILTQLDRDGFEGTALKEALQHLREDPDWAPTGPHTSVGTLTLNNLPLGDYDETGLVGRRRELEKLTKRLLELGSSRSPVLTVIGPGGVGKTALVLQALHDLVNDESCPYDLVSWVSLKTEQLTARGVQLIQDAVLSVEQAVPAMIEALEPSFDGTASQLADALDGLTALIVIDNLETVTGREVVNLIDALPNTVSYLLTSREGLGELERRFPLEPLNDRYAVELLRRLARARQLESYAKMDQDIAIDLVHRLGASPLGLKWFISSLEVGKDPEELVRHRDDFVRFCVENVFESLDKDAKAASKVLHLLARPATVQDLHLYLPDISPDRLRASIQALDRRMLVRRDLVIGSIAETFEATGPLSDYLAIEKVVEPDEVQRIREADDEYRLAEERHRLDSATDPLRPNIIQGGPAHRASVLRLRNALSQSKRGELANALESIRDAEHLDPEFWEIHRVRGFILSSSGRVDDATGAYTRAVELAPSARDAAAVKYFFAGHLTRTARDSARAVLVAQEAHDVLGVHKTAVELGRALTYVGDYNNAEEILKQAMYSDDLRTRLIAVTQLIDCMKRRAEAEASVERLPDKAVATLASAIEIGRATIRKGVVDRRLSNKIVDLASELLRCANMCREESATQDAVYEALVAVRGIGHDARRTQSFGYLIGHARRLVSHHPHLVAAVPLVSEYALEGSGDVSDASANLAEDTTTLLGTIRVWKADRRFGFIAGLNRGDDVYFNCAALASAADEILLTSGAVVRFGRVLGRDGRPQARDVDIEEPDMNVLEDRKVRVGSLHHSGNYLFSTDTISGATVFVGRHSLQNDSQWNELVPGSELELTVEIDLEGRFSATANSARTLA